MILYGWNSPEIVHSNHTYFKPTCSAVAMDVIAWVASMIFESRNDRWTSIRFEDQNRFPVVAPGIALCDRQIVSAVCAGAQ
jgi:hypothetical protein